MLLKLQGRNSWECYPAASLPDHPLAGRPRGEERGDGHTGPVLWYVDEQTGSLQGRCHQGRSTHICLIDYAILINWARPFSIWAASSEFGTYRLCEQWAKRDLQTESQILAPLNGWTCAVKICHDGMLEDTNFAWRGSYKECLLHFFIFFFSISNRNSCKQKCRAQIRRHCLRLLIWFYTVCVGHKKGR